MLRDYASRTPSGKPRALRLRFLTSPVAILGEGKVEVVEVVRNRLEDDGSGRLKAVPTDERETIPAGLVLRSVGYRGIPLPGVPFDEQRATIRNDCGRALDESGQQVPGVYCAGWIKRGPSGVIGTNKKDATETVELLLEDARAGKLGSPIEPTAAAIDAVLDEHGVTRVVYDGWLAIVTHERGLGEPQGRPRVKLCSWDELLAAASSVATCQT